MREKLIVFEGTDGSGKTTQARMLARRLRDEGIRFREIDFPRYGNPFAEPARLYLSGVLGSRPEDVNAYAVSTLYAIDRYVSYLEDIHWEAWSPCCGGGAGKTRKRSACAPRFRTYVPHLAASAAAATAAVAVVPTAAATAPAAAVPAVAAAAPAIAPASTPAAAAADKADDQDDPQAAVVVVVPHKLFTSHIV